MLTFRSLKIDFLSISNALKPEKSAFRLDGSTIFQNSSFRSILRFCLFLACLGGPLGLVLEGLWGVLGLSWPFLSHLGPSQARSGQVMPFRIRTRSVGDLSPPPPGQEGVHPSYKDGSALETHPGRGSASKSFSVCFFLFWIVFMRFRAFFCVLVGF